MAKIEPMLLDIQAQADLKNLVPMIYYGIVRQTRLFGLLSPRYMAVFKTRPKLMHDEDETTVLYDSHLFPIDKVGDRLKEQLHAITWDPQTAKIALATSIQAVRQFKEYGLH